jgi:hypothetical protein
MPTPATTFRLSQADLRALDAIAADMGSNRTAALRKVVYEELDRRGLSDQAAANLAARLTARFGPAAVIVVTTNTGATQEGATVTINGTTPAEARAVLLVDRGELRIEEPDGPGSITLVTMATGQPGELRWQGTLAELASIVPGSE